jgi:hypothetical protein
MKRILLIPLFFSLTAMAGDWTVQATADADRVRVTHPDLAAAIDSLQPIRNRAGKYFFPGKELVSEPAQALLLDRLIRGDDDSEVQVALAYGLVGPLPWAFIAERPAPVRVALLEAHKKADDASALLAGMNDQSNEVVAEAVRLLGYSPDTNAQARSLLERALSNESGEVRRLAARSIGWRGHTESFEKVQALLDDTRPGVREAAVRSLGKLDAERAAALPGLVNLANDAHPGTARAVRSVLQR